MRQWATMSTDAHSSLTYSDIPAAVTSTLRQYVDSRLAEVHEIDPAIDYAGQLLRDFVLNGGKRIRPLYAWAGFQGAGGFARQPHLSPESVVHAISALELIQACALIHDDLIDASDTRRGAPTVHRAVQARHASLSLAGSDVEFGAAIAILLGDLALAWADDMLNDAGLDDATLRRVRPAWRAMRTEVIAGQILDISAHAAENEDIEEAWKINRFKTAAYTIERPLHLGAALADADHDIIDAYGHYGRDIGIAFQLRDDMLGVYGDPEVTGKPAGDDLREGKRTVLFTTALHRADATNPDAAQHLRRGIGTVSDAEDIAHLTGLLTEMGADEVVEEHITRLTTQGLSALDGVPLAAGAHDVLVDLARRATARRM